MTAQNTTPHVFASVVTDHGEVTFVIVADFGSVTFRGVLNAKDLVANLMDVIDSVEKMREAIK